MLSSSDQPTIRREQASSTAAEDVELATLGWVHWHNTRRLHGHLDDQPPIEYEQTFYAADRDDHSPESHSAGLHQTQGGSGGLQS